MPRGVVSQLIAALVGRVRNIITIAAENPLQLISGRVQVIAARLGASACKSSKIKAQRVLGHIIKSATLRGCTIAGGFLVTSSSRQFSEGALLPAGIVSQLIAALVRCVRNITTIAAESLLQLISGRVQVIAA